MDKVRIHDISHAAYLHLVYGDAPTMARLRSRVLVIFALGLLAATGAVAAVASMASLTQYLVMAACGLAISAAVPAAATLVNQWRARPEGLHGVATSIGVGLTELGRAVCDSERLGGKGLLRSGHVVSTSRGPAGTVRLTFRRVHQADLQTAA